MLANRINDCVSYLNSQTRYILSKILVQRAILVGFLINQEELLRGEKFNTFWKEVASNLVILCCSICTRTILFEARYLFMHFKRFAYVIDGDLKIENIRVPLKLSKRHLLLLSKHCNNEVQQDTFIEIIMRYSLNVSQLKAKLFLGITSKHMDIQLTIGDLIIKKSYDLSCLGIDETLSENKIRDIIVANITVFIKIVMGDNWGFLPNNAISIGGRPKYLDLVFYNVVMHRYLIIELKSRWLVSDIDRATSQIISYTRAYDEILDLTFQKRTIGIVLGKEPIGSEYFNSAANTENIFYAGFII
jgi:predicted nuclease of restriction endonuclease-like (RecB) superfamily